MRLQKKEKKKFVQWHMTIKIIKRSHVDEKRRSKNSEKSSFNKLNFPLN